MIATALDTALGGINDRLDEHPNEVIMLFFEDYVSPEDMDAAFNRSRLIDYVYTHTPGAPFPTLREMIANDERVVVLSENVGSRPKPDWYHDGFSLVQETPYAFRTPQEMNCKPNRGQPDNPLCQINNWIEGILPAPGNAAKSMSTISCSRGPGNLSFLSLTPAMPCNLSPFLLYVHFVMCYTQPASVGWGKSGGMGCQVEVRRYRGSDRAGAHAIAFHTADA